MRVSLRSRIYVGFGLVIGLVIAMGIASVTLSGRTTRGIGDFKEALGGVGQIEAINVQTQKVRVGVGHWLSQPSDATKQTVDKMFALLKQMIAQQAAQATTPEEQKLYAQLGQALATYDKTWTTYVAAAGKFDLFFNHAISNPAQDMQQQLKADYDNLPPNTPPAQLGAMTDLIADMSAAMGNATQLGGAQARTDVSTAQGFANQAQNSLNVLKHSFAVLMASITDPHTKSDLSDLGDSINYFISDFGNAVNMLSDLTTQLQALNSQGTSLDGIAVRIKAAADASAGSAQTSLVASVQNANRLQVIGDMIVAVIAIVFGYLTARSVVRPLTDMTGAMTTLAQGDLSVAVPWRGRKDEIGAMADAVQVFKDNAEEVARLQADQAAQASRLAEERRRALNEMATQFEASVRSVVSEVTEASEHLQQASTAMSAVAEQTSRQSMTVAAAAEQASVNVQTVASAAEELSVSSTDIAREIARSASIAGQAAEEARATGTTVDHLTESAQRIGDVVSLINDIASQTNLLALNATIEAARAGDAGRGFAVVAQEVKALAAQTAHATEEIVGQIQAMQGATKEAVSAIRSIGKIIGEVNEISLTIRAATEQQQATTSEISRSVQQAAAGTQDVSANITGVTRAAGETGDSANVVQQSAETLGRQAQTLSQAIDGFIRTLRAA